ncbi:MAG: hypothetical protein ACRC1H_04170, partial [Caldilineaceae bacterium]
MSDYLKGLLGEDDPDAPRRAGVLQQASTTNPDTYARQRRYAELLALPVDAVTAIPDEMEQRAKHKQIEAATADTPALRRKYTEADFARLAQDDSSALSRIERAVGKAARYAVGADEGGGLPGDVVFGARALASSLPSAGAALYGAAAAPLELAGQALGDKTLGAGMRAQQTNAKAVAKKWMGLPEDAGFVRTAVASGLQSAGQSLAILPV